MDWPTIFTAVLTSLLSSSLITAGIIYILKKGIDRAIDLRYEKLLEEVKVQVQETARRKSALYDQQSKALQDCISHLHRLRRLARDMENVVSPEIKGAKRREFDELLDEFNQRYQEFMDFVSEQRVLLPRRFAEAQHDINGLLTSVRGYHDLLERTKNDRATSEQMILVLKRSLTRLDEEYVKLLEEAQKMLGISESGSRD